MLEMRVEFHSRYINVVRGGGGAGAEWNSWHASNCTDAISAVQMNAVRNLLRQQVKWRKFGGSGEQGKLEFQAWSWFLM